MKSPKMPADILGALYEVLERIEGYVDIKDGPDGTPVPNDAMIAKQEIEELLAKYGEKV